MIPDNDTSQPSLSHHFVGTSVSVDMNVTDSQEHTFLFPDVPQDPQLYPVNRPKVQNRKRQRLVTQMGDNGNGNDMDQHTEANVPCSSCSLSSSSSSSSSSIPHEDDHEQNDQYKLQQYTDDTDGSSEEEEEETDETKKTKKARTTTKNGNDDREDREVVRRNQSPACRYELVRIALIRFRELNGNTYVKRGFIVPKGSEDWPEETWGIRLDLAVRKIREGTTYADHLDDLRSLGFSFDSCRGGYGFNMLKQGVLKYQELHGDMNITRSFVIPKDSADWPEDMWGVHLGSCLRDIKRGKCYADRKEELCSIGYNFLIHGRANGKKYDFNRIKLAFETYKAVVGDLLVPAKFKVPSGDDAWPAETWGLKLGTYTQLIRMGKYGEDKREELLDLGFMFDNQRAKYGFDLVKCALLKYKDIYGNFLVKQKFLVPSAGEASSADWPEKTWGIKLGNALHDIRQGDSYRNKREELEDLGIVFYSHKQPRGRSTTSSDPAAQGASQEGYETFGGIGGNGGLGSHGNQGQIQGHNNGQIQGNVQGQIQGQIRNQIHGQGNHGQGYITGGMQGQAEGQMNHNSPQHVGGPHQGQRDIMHAHPSLTVTHSNNAHSHHSSHGHGKEEGADV